VNYAILWDNDHACGELPGRYPTIEEATKAAQQWKAEMVTLDDDPEEASRVYSWAVITANQPSIRKIQMTITARIDLIIADLSNLKADAEKCDSGMAGAPGTRIRKAASQITKDLKDLRVAVIEIRNA
jgi:hypothetical protein